MIIVINNNTIQQYNNIQQQYDTVIQFYKSMNDHRGNRLYFDFHNAVKQYVNNQNVLFIVIIMDDQKGRQFAFKRQVYGVPSLAVYKNGQKIKYLCGIPIQYQGIIQIKQQIISLLKGIQNNA